MSPPPFFLAILLILLCSSATAQTSNFPTANLSTTWTNKYNESDPGSFVFSDGSTIRTIFYPQTLDGSLRFACGFYCNGDCTSYLFAIFAARFYSDYRSDVSFPPRVIWSANRDSPVGYGAILNLTAAGQLVLQDVNGSEVWTTNTSGKSVVGMKFNSTGNLVLFDVDGNVVWQSFDHPTDCLVLGQKLVQGQKLIASVSETNWTKGLCYLELINGRFSGYVESLPPQRYFSMNTEHCDGRCYVRFLNGSFSFFNDESSKYSIPVKSLPHAVSEFQYMKLMPDGRWVLFDWHDQSKALSEYELIRRLGACNHPLDCGRNSICSTYPGVYDKACNCPYSRRDMYFRRYYDDLPGCFEITPLTCNATQDQDFIELEDVAYFTDMFDMKGVSMEACKQACLKNCSCKAALFEYDEDPSSGDCYLPSELFTMRRITPTLYGQNASTFIKVQNVRRPPIMLSSDRESLPMLAAKVLVYFVKDLLRFAISITILIGVLVLPCVVVSRVRKCMVHKEEGDAEMNDEEYFDQVPGLPTRFSFEELKTATKNFSKKLGEGGFGSVYEGTLEDGSNIAVKCLEGHMQVKQSFIAEVQSIGSIHHVNLVRLRGFCAHKSQPFLVYDFMSNGSLDRWIYHGDREHVLGWECRKKIVVDIAKGLAYLHEDCRQKIIHLDIKPQNILLDDEFNAKIADFGLSKLVDRNQTQVMTIMRGTPGYMAPEWMSSIITEKVDVYSFGIVLLEILCGRKNFDRSQMEESWHLLRVFQTTWEQEKLFDIVDMHSDDMQAHATEVVEMMKLVSWCLQSDFTRRPSMSSVIKVLEGGMNVESDLDYNFTDPRLQKAKIRHGMGLTQLLPSILSGPR